MCQCQYRLISLLAEINFTASLMFFQETKLIANHFDTSSTYFGLFECSTDIHGKSIDCKLNMSKISININSISIYFKYQGMFDVRFASVKKPTNLYS